MDSSLSKPRWWLIATAAILAVLTLYYFTGSWVIVALFFALLAMLLGYQAKRTGKSRSHACVRCGAALNRNARECRSCGSASWTIRD